MTAAVQGRIQKLTNGVWSAMLTLIHNLQSILLAILTYREVSWPTYSRWAASPHSLPLGSAPATVFS